MSSFDDQQNAATRGLEDAKAANAVTQTTGQTLVLINGGAATATATFSYTTSAPVHLNTAFLGLSLACFAVGVVFSARYLGFQGERLQYWGTYWDSRAQIWDKEMGDDARKAANALDTKVGRSFDGSIYSFALGVIIIGISFVVSWATSQVSISFK